LRSPARVRGAIRLLSRVAAVLLCEPAAKREEFSLRRVRTGSANCRAVGLQNVIVPNLSLISISSMVGAQGIEPWTRLSQVSGTSTADKRRGRHASAATLFSYSGCGWNATLKQFGICGRSRCLPILPQDRRRGFQLRNLWRQSRPLHNADYQLHYKWCLTAPDAARNSEQSARKDFLNKCLSSTL
jgi:hypothetical protein